MRASLTEPNAGIRFVWCLSLLLAAVLLVFFITAIGIYTVFHDYSTHTEASVTSALTDRKL